MRLNFSFGYHYKRWRCLGGDGLPFVVSRVPWQQDNGTTTAPISIKIGGRVKLWGRKNLLEFEADPNKETDTMLWLTLRDQWPWRRLTPVSRVPWQQDYRKPTFPIPMKLGGRV